ncbi:hypothetical protein DPMN_156628 [Dreissena polymorpha]|uniref:Uncharacterized protein n=1 Tax=Dreissena polymorpha TaxID=45954 RepID=A0A9D4FQ64_DREPO|nr:hypothetical protein DPMN_156628 [Dreissena polymorpha]
MVNGENGRIKGGGLGGGRQFEGGSGGESLVVEAVLEAVVEVSAKVVAAEAIFCAKETMWTLWGKRTNEK